MTATAWPHDRLDSGFAEDTPAGTYLEKKASPLPRWWRELRCLLVELFGELFQSSDGFV